MRRASSECQRVSGFEPLIQKGLYLKGPQIADKVPDKALVLMRALCFYGDMLKKPEVPQQEMELVTIESLVPFDHLLRKIHVSIDLDFIRERVRHLYCEDNGRPALDPVVLF